MSRRRAPGSRHERLPFTVFLGALSALPPLSIDMGLPGIPAIEATFPAAEGRGPLTLGLFLAGFALAPLFCGALADRFGRRPLLLCGLGLFVAAALAAACAGSFSVLLACRLLQGAAAGACVVLPLAIVRDLFESTVARTRLAQVGAVLGIAPIVAPVLGAWIMAFGSWRIVYGAQAAVGAVLLLVAAATFEETLRVDRRRRLDRAQLFESYAMVVSDRAFRDYSLVYALEFACVFAFVSGAPAVLMQGFGLSSHAFAWLFAIVTCFALLGSLASTVLSKREIASRTVLACGLVAMGVATLAASGVALTAWMQNGLPRLVVLMPLIAIAVFSFEASVPSANHEALRGLRHVAGSASGLMRSTQMAAGAAASLAIAGLERLGQPLVTMTLTMAVCAIGAGLVFRLRPKEHAADIALPHF